MGCSEPIEMMEGRARPLSSPFLRASVTLQTFLNLQEHASAFRWWVLIEEEPPCVGLSACVGHREEEEESQVAFPSIQSLRLPTLKRLTYI